MDNIQERAMTPAQIEWFKGKRIDPNIWTIPEGYGFCAITAKFQHEDDLLVTFPHCNFTDEQLAQLGPYGVGWCEDADWMSEEGWYIIKDRVIAAGLLHVLYGDPEPYETEGAKAA